MDTTEQLITGYTAYTHAEEMGAPVEGEAPATTTLTATPSTLICAGAISVAVTVVKGC